LTNDSYRTISEKSLLVPENRSGHVQCNSEDDVTRGRTRLWVYKWPIAIAGYLGHGAAVGGGVAGVTFQEGAGLPAAGGGKEKSWKASRITSRKKALTYGRKKPGKRNRGTGNYRKTRCIGSARSDTTPLTKVRPMDRV